MSYNSRDNGRRRTMPSHSSGVGHWIPLALTVTVATIGLAAWIWKERQDNEEENGKNDDRPPPGYNGSSSNQPSYGPGPGPQRPYDPTSQGYPQGPGGYPSGGQSNFPPGLSGPPGSFPSGDQPPYAQGRQVPYAPGSQPPYPPGNQGNQDDTSVVQRVAGALRRTPSPQQILDGASRRVAAGVAAAGAMVGGALSSIREEDKRDFEDHSRWSEEATKQHGGTKGSSSGQKSGNRRKTVAIVISAETTYNSLDEDVSYHQEHASILSHLPEHIDADSRVFIMIYDPSLNAHPLASHTTTPTTGQLPASVTSSYSNIAPEDGQSPPPSTTAIATAPSTLPPSATSRSAKFNTLYAQALALVDTPAMVMPFTTPAGYVALLKHTAPEVVYVQAPLAGVAGEAIKHVAGWVGQVVLVVGDESGHGGLVDSEDEHGGPGGEGGAEKWWVDDPKIGLGKGIEVVEGLRVGEDWRRRVKGHD